MMNIVLVHGFNKSSKDMRPLQLHLEALGHRCFVPDLQLTYKEIDVSVFLLEGVVENLLHLTLTNGEQLHFVGHSTGGLVIRKWLATTKYESRVGRVVCVASPNNGSQLATIASQVKPYVKVFQTLKSLSFEAVSQLNEQPIPQVEIGAIAGNKNNLLLGKLISSESDGRVEVNSVYMENLQDFLVLPYGHKEIHHQLETATYVEAFLTNGQFNKKRGV